MLKQYILCEKCRPEKNVQETNWIGIGRIKSHVPAPIYILLWEMFSPCFVRIRSVIRICWENMVPPEGLDLNTLFDELADIHNQLEPYIAELEELGL